MPVRFQTIIDVDNLKALLGSDNLIVVDCRFSLADTESGLRAYVEARIPGAFYAHLDEDLSTPVGDGSRGRHPLPSKSAVRELLRRFGATPASQIVVYDDMGGAIASRLWWMARWGGHKDVAVLDGGWNAWSEAEAPVETGAPSARPIDSSETGQWPDTNDAEWLVDAGDLTTENRLFPLIDSRGTERYSGENEPIDRVAGHIPGAVNIPFIENMAGDSRLRRVDALRRRFEGLYADNASPVFYCGSGVTACHNILATQVAGLPMPRLFPGSWSGWVSDPERPVETE